MLYKEKRLRALSQKIINEAKKLLLVSQGLDYQKVLAHDGGEVEKLRNSLLGLNIRWGDRSLADYANKLEAPPPGANSAVQKGSEGIDTQGVLSSNTVARQGKIVEALSEEGFSERSDCVYSSFVKSRSLPFKQVPHRHGLPDFDIVVAPDFSPNPGLHGIFISADAVMSITLAIVEGQSAQLWQIEKQQNYSSQEQMVDYVTLMSAGFELPE
jgi:hypothetical protein